MCEYVRMGGSCICIILSPLTHLIFHIFFTNCSVVFATINNSFICAGWLFPCNKLVFLAWNIQQAINQGDFDVYKMFLKCFSSLNLYLIVMFFFSLFSFNWQYRSKTESTELKTTEEICFQPHLNVS